MATDSTIQKEMQRVGELVERFELHPDSEVRAMVKQLLESFMAFHSAGLERLLEITASTGPTGRPLIENYGTDECVSGLLLLYGLHPHDLRTRVARTAEAWKNSPKGEGVDIDSVSVGEDGAVSVRLVLRSSGCGSSAATLKNNLLAAMQDAAPDASSISVEITGSGITPRGFVSVEELLGNSSTSRQTTALGQRG